MKEIVTASRRKLSHRPHLLDDMHRLRHRVFHDKLGWDVSSRNGLEIDQFDALDPTYMLASDHHGHVEGTWRLLPTSGPYMLKDVFPQLLRGERAPEDPDIWEISRFAVSPRNDYSRAQANLNEISFDMIRAAYDFAVAKGISHYVFATSVALERLFLCLGLPVYRFGDQKAQRIGKVLSVGCWLDVNEQFQRAVSYTGEAPRNVLDAI